MKCTNCSSELTDGALFCPHCGKPVEPAAAQPEAPAYFYAPTDAPEQARESFSAPVQEAAPVDAPAPSMIFCGHCGNQVPANAEVCSACGLPPTTVQTPPAPKKKSKLGLWILAAVASLLVVVVIAGLCTNWFGINGPVAQIASAANKTLNAGSFTVDLNMVMESDSSYGDYSREVEGTVQVILNPKDRELMMYAELESDDETAVMAIYDECVIFGAGEYFNKEDISDALDTFFDNYDSKKELDWEELLNSIDEDLYDEVSEVIDFDKLDKCLSAYAKDLNSEKWLKENAGYSSDKKNGVMLHQFKPKPYKFLNASLSCFEDAFEDDDDFDDLMDDLKDNRSEMNSVGLNLTFGVKSGKLSSFEMEMKQDSNTTKLELQFDKIGKTSIDESELQDLLDKAS